MPSEYNALLKIGRVSVENNLCTITPFLTGNRMVYCTRCWCLGHMSDKCNMKHPRCRICLNNLIDSQSHDCSNIWFDSDTFPMISNYWSH